MQKHRLVPKFRRVLSVADESAEESGVLDRDHYKLMLPVQQHFVHSEDRLLSESEIAQHTLIL